MNSVCLLDDKVIIGLSIGGGVIALLVMVALILLIVASVSKKVKSKKSNEIRSNILTHLGGKDNITYIEAKGSRLVVSLIDRNLLNEEDLKSLGVTGIIKTSNKITLVMGNLASEVVELYNNQ